MPCPTCDSPWPARRGQTFGSGPCSDPWHDQAQEEPESQGMVETLAEPKDEADASTEDEPTKEKPRATARTRKAKK
jgi:hypothetical protein